MSTLWVPGQLPGLNEIINAKRQRYGGKADGYSAMKKNYGQYITLLSSAQGLCPVMTTAFSYLFIEPSKRRDPSNFISGGIKIIEDGLQEAGLLENDGWANVGQISAYWTVNKTRPGVLVVMNANGWNRNQLMELFEGGVFA